MLWVEKFGGKMQEDQKAETSNLEDNLSMVSYIMLHRIYDLLTLIADKVAGSENTQKMISYHEAGYLLGPVPAFSPAENEDDIQN
jgi:hypothetical protein